MKKFRVLLIEVLLVWCQWRTLWEFRSAARAWLKIFTRGSNPHGYAPVWWSGNLEFFWQKACYMRGITRKVWPPSKSFEPQQEHSLKFSEGGLWPSWLHPCSTSSLAQRISSKNSVKHKKWSKILNIINRHPLAAQIKHIWKNNNFIYISLRSSAKFALNAEEWAKRKILCL